MSTKNMSSDGLRCSSGYFKDPVTLKELTPETQRVNNCDDGFKWPKFRCSDGRVLPIVFSAFTQKEKEAYYEMRKKGNAGPKKNELRETLLKLQNVLNEQIKDTKVLKEANTLIESILPDAPKSNLQKKVEKMSKEEKEQLLALLSA